MTQERYDIVVTDKVDKSLDAKFEQIAKAARDAHKSIADLQESIAKTNGRAVEIAANRMAAAAAKQQTQQQRLSESAARTAVQQQRLATETQRTATAIAQTEAVVNRSIATESRARTAALEAAAAQQKLAAETQRAAAARLSAEAVAQRVIQANNQTAASLTNLAAAQIRAANASQQAQATALAGTNNVIAAQTKAAVQAQKLATEQQRTATASGQAATAQQRLAAASQTAAAASIRAGTASTQQATAAQRLAQATAQATAAQDRAALTAIRLAGAQERAARDGNYITDGLTRFAARAFVAVGAWQTLTNAFAATETFTNLQNKLRLVAGSQQRVVELTDELLGAANRSRAPLEATVTTFQRIDAAIKQAGGTQRESLLITEALTKSVSANGLAAQEQASALLQVSQAFNKGKLDGDEFRSVMENFPALADAIAQALGLANRGFLFEASKEGKINLDVLRKAMELLGKTADQQAAGATVTVSQAFNQLANSSTVLIGRLNEQLGVTRALASAMQFLNSIIEKQAKAQAPQTIAQELSDQESKLKLLDEQFAKMRDLVDAGKAGLSGEQKLNRILETRANIQKRVNELQAEQQQTSRGQFRAAETVDAQQLSLKTANDAARKKADEEDAAKKARRRGRTPAQEIEDEIQRLREKTEVLGDVTEVQRLESQIIAGRYAAAKPAQIDELYNLARKRDLEREVIAQERERLIAAEHSRQQQIQQTAALEQETRALQDSNEQYEIEVRNLGATAYALAIVEQARLNSLAASREFQAERIESTEGITAETAALRAQAEELRKRGNLGVSGTNKAFIQQQTGIEAPTDLLVGTEKALAQQLLLYQQYYEQINQLEKNRTLTVEEAGAARLRLDNAAEAARLKNTTTFLGNLSELQKSKSKEIAKIGKAAAIAGAIIDTYKAANAAYAAMAGIPVVGPVLGAAAAGAAIAAGIANVNAIRSQGYMSGGYTGNYATNEVAGVVHGREFVVNAEATKRNRATLEAMNSGSDSGKSGFKLTVNQYGTPQSYEVQSVTRDQVVLIARDEAKKIVKQDTSLVVAGELSDSNSRISKSLQRNTNSVRNR